MAAAHHQQDPSYLTDIEPSTRTILLPDGYELAHYTLRRINDGHLQSYLPINASATPVQATPIAAQISDLQPQGALQANQETPLAGSMSPLTSTNQSPYHMQTLQQQLHSIPIRGGPNTFATSNSTAKELSKLTQKRHAHSRDDNYTNVCGVYSPEKATPVKRYNHGKGEFCCPRCGSNFTRPKSVKDHFPDCVGKYGNPQSLRYTDHSSMAQKEAAIQRRRQASREASNLEMEGVVYQPAGSGQMIKLEEMSDTLGHTSVHAIAGSATADDGPHIKTEFVFAADIVHESIETPSPEQQSQSASLDLQYTSLQPTSASSEHFIAQTPDWARSAAEQSRMNPRATAEWWTPEAQTPKGTNGDGLQDDGLDAYMDRRSYFSTTPAAGQPPSKMENIDEECEMED